MFVGSLINYEESVLAEQELRNLQGMVYWIALQEQEHEPGTEDILRDTARGSDRGIDR
jgi:hypothetical protein